MLEIMLTLGLIADEDTNAKQERQLDVEVLDEQRAYYRAEVQDNSVPDDDVPKDDTTRKVERYDGGDDEGNDGVSKRTNHNTSIVRNGDDDNTDDSAGEGRNTEQVDEQEVNKQSQQEPEKETDNHAETISVKATAYHAMCDTGCNGTTRTGKDVTNTTLHNGRKIIAADPGVIPLGTNVRITLESGEVIDAVVEDTGGNIQGNRIDILVNSDSEAREFGRQSAEVEVLD